MHWALSKEDSKEDVMMDIDEENELDTKKQYDIMQEIRLIAVIRNEKLESARENETEAEIKVEEINKKTRWSRIKTR
jgi:hypothetical protein